MFKDIYLQRHTYLTRNHTGPCVTVRVPHPGRINTYKLPIYIVRIELYHSWMGLSIGVRFGKGKEEGQDRTRIAWLSQSPYCTSEIPCSYIGTSRPSARSDGFLRSLMDSASSSWQISVAFTPLDCCSTICHRRKKDEIDAGAWGVTEQAVYAASASTLTRHITNQSFISQYLTNSVLYSVMVAREMLLYPDPYILSRLYSTGCLPRLPAKIQGLASQNSSLMISTCSTAIEAFIFFFLSFSACVLDSAFVSSPPSARPELAATSACL